MAGKTKAQLEHENEDLKEKMLKTYKVVEEFFGEISKKISELEADLKRREIA